MSTDVEIGDEPWWYVLAEKRLGPVPRKQLIELHVDGVLTLDSLVWAEGMTEWVPLGQVVALRADLISALRNVRPVNPPPIPAGHRPKVISPSATSGTQSVTSAVDAPLASAEKQFGEVRVATYWPRLWARCVDLPIVWVLSSAIAIFLPDFRPSIPGIGGLVLEILVSALLICIVIFVYESFFVSRFGATPGKMLFGLVVRTMDNRIPTFEQAKTRAWVYLRLGLYFGLWFPNLQVLGAGFAFRRRAGLQPWDIAAGTMISQRTIGTTRFLIVTVCAVLTFSFAVMAHQGLKQMTKKEIRNGIRESEFKNLSSNCQVAIPALDEWLERARSVNPGVSDDALTEYWVSRYARDRESELRKCSGR